MKLRTISLAVLAATTATAQDSFYEIQAAATNDLVGMRLTGTLVGSTYQMTLAPGLGVTVPVGASQLVGIGDDVEVDSASVGGTLGMYIGSNGWLATGPGNSTSWVPYAPLFLNNPSTAVVSWTDMSPNLVGSGGVYYSESGTVATVTFDGVFGFGTMDENTFSIEYDTATGNFAIEWAAVGAGNPEELLIGFGLGGLTADPGQVDISAAAPFAISLPATATVSSVGSGCGGGGGVLDLQLDPVGTPIQGAAAIAFDVTTSNIPVGTVSHVGILGLTAPVLPLASVGMPGCFLNAGLDFLTLELGAFASGSHTWTVLTIPGTSFGVLNGFQFHVQAASFGTSLNNFLGLGAITSNGLTCTIGDV